MDRDKLVSNYFQGYRNGHLDRLLGISLMIAKTSTIPLYAQGYLDGNNKLNPNANKHLVRS